MQYYALMGNGNRWHFPFEASLPRSSTDGKTTTIDINCYHRLDVVLRLHDTGMVVPNEYITVAVSHPGEKIIRNFSNVDTAAIEDNLLQTVYNHPTVFYSEVTRNGVVSSKRDSVVFTKSGEVYEVRY
jgi:hypothetical protein